MTKIIAVLATCFVMFACNSSEDDFHRSFSKSNTDESIEEPELSLKYSVLRQWKPNDMPNGFGAEILLDEAIEELEESDLVAFIRMLAKNSDPVNIRIFTSRVAYEQEQNSNYGPEYNSDYLLAYIKNYTRRGAFQGFNEIRWMQEDGKFSSKFGITTKL